MNPLISVHETAPTPDFGPEFHEPLRPDITAELQDSFLPYWHELSKQNYGTNTLPGNDDFREAFQKELRFFEKVYDAATTMGERHHGTVTVLFDVDETLIEGELVRPSFSILARHLHETLGDRVEIGLLTTKPQAHVDEEAISPTYMADLSGLTNPDFFISSRHWEKSYPHLQTVAYGDDLDAKLAAAGDLIDPAITAETVAGRMSPNTWYHTKLAILADLADSCPDRSFIFVDDLASADVIRDDHAQVAGVYVFEEMQNDRQRLIEAALKAA